MIYNFFIRHFETELQTNNKIHRVFKTKHFLLFFLGLTGKLFGVFTLTVKLERRPAGQTATLTKRFVVPGCKHGFIAVGLVVLT